MTKEKTAVPTANDTPPEATQANADELKALNEAIAKQAEILAQADEKIETLEAENEDLKAINEGLKSTIEELNAALSAKDGELEQKGGYPTIKHGKDSYELRLKKFIHRIDGKAVEVDEQYLKDNPEVVKDLIAKKSGALVKKGGK